ncbi:hypothetical protein HK102_001584, partial [Quaeritorhiza haematococci]
MPPIPEIVAPDIDLGFLIFGTGSHSAVPTSMPSSSITSPTPSTASHPHSPEHTHSDLLLSPSPSHISGAAEESSLANTEWPGIDGSIMDCLDINEMLLENDFSDAMVPPWVLGSSAEAGGMSVFQEVSGAGLSDLIQCASGWTAVSTPMSASACATTSTFTSIPVPTVTSNPLTSSNLRNVLPNSSETKNTITDESSSDSSDAPTSNSITSPTNSSPPPTSTDFGPLIHAFLLPFNQPGKTDRNADDGLDASRSLPPTPPSPNTTSQALPSTPPDVLASSETNDTSESDPSSDSSDPPTSNSITSVINPSPPPTSTDFGRLIHEFLVPFDQPGNTSGNAVGGASNSPTSPTPDTSTPTTITITNTSSNSAGSRAGPSFPPSSASAAPPAPSPSSQAASPSSPSSPSYPPSTSLQTVLDSGALDPTTGITLSAQPLSLRFKLPNSQTRKFPCEFKDCGKVFSRKSNLNSHMVSHLAERPFLCGWERCGATFKRNYDLKRHIKAKHG